MRLVARGLGQSRAVAVDVVAGSLERKSGNLVKDWDSDERHLGGDGGIGGSGHSLTLGHCHRLANTAHTNSTLEPEESTFWFDLLFFTEESSIT